ncbi:conserved Plasmodium protein, unknown function [Plasmodium ovale]|uniref:FMR1-interacting protein 1 conserved domain-containing protein n=1 Tax=Plasmodium ovale TaxID=36330 RepID=A0A1C3KVI2_PLAOA|nr:conserved Plasmodium protein, unknown function [Plasmodium ovale]
MFFAFSTFFLFFPFFPFFPFFLLLFFFFLFFSVLFYFFLHPVIPTGSAKKFAKFIRFIRLLFHSSSPFCKHKRGKILCGDRGFSRISNGFGVLQRNHATIRAAYICDNFSIEKMDNLMNVNGHSGLYASRHAGHKAGLYANHRDSEKNYNDKFYSNEKGYNFFHVKCSRVQGESTLNRSNVKEDKDLTRNRRNEANRTNGPIDLGRNGYEKGQCHVNELSDAPNSAIVEFNRGKQSQMNNYRSGNTEEEHISGNNFLKNYFSPYLIKNTDESNNSCGIYCNKKKSSNYTRRNNNNNLYAKGKNVHDRNKVHYRNNYQEALLKKPNSDSYYKKNNSPYAGVVGSDPSRSSNVNDGGIRRGRGNTSGVPDEHEPSGLYGKSSSLYGQSSSLHGQSSNLYSQSSNLHGQSSNLHGQSSNLHGQSSNLYSQSSNLHGQSSNLHGQSSNLHGQSSNLYSQSSNLHGQSSNLHGQSSNLHGQSSNLYSQSSNLHGQSSNLHGQSSNLHGQSSNLYSQSSNLHGQSSNLHGQSSNLHGQSSNLYSQSSNLHGQSSNLHGQSSNLYGQSSNLYGQSSNLYGQSSSLYGQSSRSYGKSASFHDQCDADRKTRKAGLQAYSNESDSRSGSLITNGASGANFDANNCSGDTSCEKTKKDKKLVKSANVENGANGVNGEDSRKVVEGNNKNEKTDFNHVGNVEPIPPNCIYCSQCDIIIKEKNYEAHEKAKHIKCPIENCNQIYNINLLDSHLLSHMKNGKNKNIMNDSEEIKIWINERKKNFPTKNKIMNIKNNEPFKERKKPNCLIEELLFENYCSAIGRSMYIKKKSEKSIFIPLLRSLSQGDYKHIYKNNHHTICNKIHYGKNKQYIHANIMDTLNIHKKAPLLYQLMKNEINIYEKKLMNCIDYITENRFFDDSFDSRVDILELPDACTERC